MIFVGSMGNCPWQGVLGSFLHVDVVYAQVYPKQTLIMKLNTVCRQILCVFAIVRSSSEPGRIVFASNFHFAHLL